MKKDGAAFIFPIEQFRMASQLLAQEKKIIKTDQEKWELVRQKLNPKQQATFDLEFKATFEEFQKFFYKTSSFDEAPVLLEKLEQLRDKGASAILLDPYELGGFNIAGVAKELPELSSEKELSLALELFRISIITGAELSKLKAYAGNGGSPSLYWLCEYLAGGIGTEWNQLKNETQYKTCFRIFCLVLAGTPEATQSENYGAVFLTRLKPDERVHKLQLEIYFRLVRSGLAPIPTEHHTSMFSCIGKIVKNGSWNWLPVLFPYEEKETGFYVYFLKESLKDSNAGNILNGFKSSKEGRKYFGSYFGYQKHWLLDHLVAQDAASIFALVRGHEFEILEPFLKHYKKELVELRDKRGSTLLHAAVLSGNSPEKIVNRLLSIGILPDTENQEGESAKDLARRKKVTIF